MFKMDKNLFVALLCFVMATINLGLIFLFNL